MSELQSIDKYKVIDEELAKSDINIFKVGNKDLSQIFLNSMTSHEPGEKIYRTRYKLNKNEIFEDFELKKDIFIQEKFLYATIDNKNAFIKRQKTIQRKIKGLSEKKLNNLIDEIEEQEEENEEEENIEKNKNKNKNKNKKDNAIILNQNNINNKNQNIDILGIEKLPPDDDPIGNPPTIDIELSDIDLEEDEESEKPENEKSEINF